jgi:hypothetical protein
VLVETAFPSYIHPDCCEMPLAKSSQVFICNHPVPLRRVGSEAPFQCPVCQGFRTHWLPHFSDSLREFSDDSVIPICRSFCRSLLRCGDDFCLFSILAKHIQILETRFVRRPEVLDDESVLILHRNLFLLGLFSLAKDDTLEPAPFNFDLALIIHEIMSRMTLGALKSTMPFDEFKGFVAAHVRDFESEGGNLFLLLRHTTLFAHFMLGCSLSQDGSLVDWDAILEASYLSQLYGLKVSAGVEMPVFKTIDLPDDWTHLGQPPYNHDILRMKEEKSIDLITGAIISRDRSHPVGDYPVVASHMLEAWNRGAVLILDLTGQGASRIQFVTLQFNVFIKAEQVFLDERGMPDIGFDRGMCLRLDREKLNVVIDDLLSGKYVGPIKP